MPNDMHGMGMLAYASRLRFAVHTWNVDDQSVAGIRHLDRVLLARRHPHVVVFGRQEVHLTTLHFLGLDRGAEVAVACLEENNV